MAYSESQIEEINNKYHEVNSIRDNLTLKLMSFQTKLSNDKANEYLMHGVLRRLKSLARCINNIFTIFPAEQLEHLSQDKLTDVNINLHSFFINIAGIFDNLGWVFVYENNLLGNPKDGKINRNGVGLFIDKTQEKLNPALREYLNSDPIKSWHDDYSKNYRDSLAHRIPLYVPPFILNKSEEKEFQEIEKKKKLLNLGNKKDLQEYDELLNKQNNLGKACLFFAHSLKEKGRPSFLHAQILADYLTVEEIIKKFCVNF